MLPSVVPDVARIGIDHGEEGADALPVFLHRPIRCPARPECVALVRPAEPVVGGAAVSSSANGEPFAIDVEGEQHRPGPSLCSAVHSWNDGGTVAVTAGAPVHRSQHPRPPALSPSHTRSAAALICRYEGSGPSQPSFGSATIGVKARARGNPASSPGEMRCGSVQDLRHPVVVDKHATDHQVLSLHYHEALAREQPPGELAGLGEQARYSLLAGRRLHGVIQP